MDGYSWYEKRGELFPGEFGPIGGFEPGVVFDLCDSVVTESALLVPLEQSVDEIEAGETPARGEVFFVDFCLVTQDFLADFFSGVAQIWSLNSWMVTVPKIS